MSFAVFALAVAIGGWLALRPLLAGRTPWPLDPPDERDDVARAVSSLRDLEFARAAGTIDSADHARLRATLERSAFFSSRTAKRELAPVRTLLVAALLTGVAAALIATNLPREAGNRAPGTLLTGTVPLVGPTTAELESRVAARPQDVPTLLALADSYRQDGNIEQAIDTHRRVLEIDSRSVPALNGLGLILYQAGEREAAMLAVDRVLTLRPRDADALFLKGLSLYQTQNYARAVEVWDVYLVVGEFHPAATMVRALYNDARGRR